MVALKPKTTAREIIIIATLSAVAKVAKRIITFEKDLLLLLIMRLAMKNGIFKIGINGINELFFLQK